ncbi:MAG: hypothetical protein ACE5FL_11705 [Myxococcota bacterium]
MNRNALKQLRLDRRLIRRRGWISSSDLEQEIAALPDVSDKIAPEEEDSKLSSDVADDTAPGAI